MRGFVPMYAYLTSPTSFLLRDIVGCSRVRQRDPIAAGLSAFAPDSVAFAEYPGVGANGVVHHEHLLLRAGGVPVVHRQRAYELVRDLYTLQRLRSP